MKKLFTLFALLACFLGANAKEIVDAEVDFSKMADGSAIKFYGWGASQSAKDRLSIKDGCLHFESTEATDPSWDCQFHPIGGVSAELDVTYTVHFKVKGDHAGNISMLGFGQTPYGQFAITTDWVEGTVDYVCSSADGGNILIQCGDWVGSWDIAYLKITHEGKEEKPVEWYTVEGMTNGDAETAWPAWALETEGGINANWRGDRTKEICAWALTMGRNFDDQCPTEIAGDASYRARPYPADIEVDPADASNHVFAAHVTTIDKIDDDNSIAWSNQFWLQSPQTYKAGTQVRVKFRCKAEKPASVPTQLHKINPSIYLNSSAIGNIDFTTDWTSYEKELTWAEGGWSIAFNLTDSNRDPNVYYFDDISFELMKLEEGLFVAASNTTTGIGYEYDTATQFEDPDEDGLFVATVGTKGKEDTWVNQVMISTVRGNDKAFKGATIKPSGTITGTDPDEWLDYSAASNAKIDLPAAGVWQITISPDPDQPQINFFQLEGEAPKEPVDIVANAEEIVIKAVARDDLKDEKNNEGVITVREDADDPNGVEVGGEGHEGQTWDNQFFIVANRVLKGGEETVIEFDCVATAAATCPTGTHAAPGAYRKNAFGDVAFTTEEQHLKFDYTVPASDWGGNAITDAQSISFDMATIKQACDYTIKNVKWYLKDDRNDQGKTLENLVDATGTKNFWVKISAGTDPYQYGTDPTDGISNVVNKVNTGSAVIYNLAGQRVSKDYKGIVVKNGKKVVVK